MPEFAELLRGYHRFRERTYPERRSRYDLLSLEGQHPKLMVIGCSDSRVDPAQIFDVEPGDIFVLRNVAALVPPCAPGSGVHGVSAAVEFAVQMLGVAQIVVMGHERCGGCKAALTHRFEEAEPGAGGFINRWIALLEDQRREVVARHGTESRDAERAMEMAAVRVSLANLLTFPFVKDKVGQGTLKLRGAYFAIAEGTLHVLDQGSGEFAPVA